MHALRSICLRTSDHFGCASPRDFDSSQEIGDEQPEIREPIGCPLQDDHCDRQGFKILLKWQTSIDRHKHITMPDRKGKQLPIFDRSPAHLPGSLDVMADDVARQAPVNTFVEQNPHETDSMSRSLACSKKAITCFRVTDGKPSINSS